MSQYNKVKGITRYVSKNIETLDYYEFASNFIDEWRDENHCKECFVFSLDIISKDRISKAKAKLAKGYLDGINNLYNNHHVKRMFQELELKRSAQERAINEKQYNDVIAANYFHATCSKTKNENVQDKNEQKEPQISKKRTKVVKKYLEGHFIDSEDNSIESIDWNINNTNVSTILRAYRREAIREAKKEEPGLNTIKELSLNCIYYFTDTSNYYELEDDVYKAIVGEIREEYQIEENKEVEEFQIEKLRPIYKEANKDLNRAKKLTKKLFGETEERSEEQMSRVLLSLFNTTLKDKMLEDVFTKKSVTPLLEPFFVEAEHLEVAGCGEESLGSKCRKTNGCGRKPDMMYKVKVDDNEQAIFLLEIKSKEIKDCTSHPDFIKLANNMKDEIDRLVSMNCRENITLFGMLVGGRFGFVLGMNLSYTGVYVLFDVGSFCLPTSSKDLAVLDIVFDTMFKLMDLLDTSKKKVLNFLKKENRPKTPPLRRHLIVKSFNSPTKQKQ